MVFLQQNYRSCLNINRTVDQAYILKSHGFSKDNYSSILEQEKSGVGEISIFNISFHEKGFVNSTQFDVLDKDIGKDLNITYLETNFIETMINASRNFLKEEFIDNNKIRIKLNESLKINFDNSSSEMGLAGFLVYLPRLIPIDVLEVHVNNTQLNKEDYTLVDDEFIRFNYFEYFNFPENNYEFSMNIIYSYEISLINWKVDQFNMDNLVATQAFHNFSAKYNYHFLVKGDKYSGAEFSGGMSEADNLSLGLLINLLDKDEIYNFSLALNEEIKSDTENYQINNGIFNISVQDSFTANSSSFKVNFTSNFKIRFLDPVTTSWAIDRLFRNNNIRQRFFFPQILDGPKHLLLKFTLYEENIADEQIQDISSQFNRPVYHLPVSKVNDSLVDQGILIYTPSLILGEFACPFTIKYEATNTLRLIITDNINMPLWYLDVEVYYNDILYGTYISNNFTQPIAPLVANENGEIILANIPSGNYRIEVFQAGHQLKTVNINTEQETHYIATNVLHFPSVVLTFGIISTIILVAGVLIFLRNARRN